MTPPAPVTGQTPAAPAVAGPAALVQPAPTVSGPAALEVARPLRILLIEVSPSDARLTQKRLRWSGITCDIAGALAEVTGQRLTAVDCALIDLT